MGPSVISLPFSPSEITESCRSGLFLCCMWAYRTEHNTSHPGRCLAFGCISKNKLTVNANLSIYSFESSFLDVMGSSKQTRKKKKVTCTALEKTYFTLLTWHIICFDGYLLAVTVRRDTVKCCMCTLCGHTSLTPRKGAMGLHQEGQMLLQFQGFSVNAICWA